MPCRSRPSAQPSFPRPPVAPLTTSPDLAQVLRTLPPPDGLEGSDCAFLRVDLHPILVPDEPTALMAIASQVGSTPPNLPSTRAASAHTACYRPPAPLHPFPPLTPLPPATTLTATMRATRLWQLRVVHSSLSGKGSFCDGLRYLLHLLRRARPGCVGEAALEGQSHPVLFVLHDFEQVRIPHMYRRLVRASAPTRPHRPRRARVMPRLAAPYPTCPCLPLGSAPCTPVHLHTCPCPPRGSAQFTLRPKQTLLYSLYDLMQTEDAHMAVIGITTRTDAADLLEKRVRSRASQRQVQVPSFESTDDCARLLQAALPLPDPNAAGAGPAFANKADPFCKAWAANTASLCASLATCGALRRRLTLGLTVGQLQVALRLALSELNARDPIIRLKHLEDALKLMGPPRDEYVLVECSDIELLLLICTLKLRDKDLPPPHTFRMVSREYAVFLATEVGGASNAQYDYPRPLLTKAFEHLIALGLIAAPREGSNRRLPFDQVRPPTACRAPRASFDPPDAPLRPQRCLCRPDVRPSVCRPSPCAPQLPVRLVVDPCVIREYTATCNYLPDRIKRFCGSLSI